MRTETTQTRRTATKQNDAGLLRKAKQGDDAALSAIYKNTYSEVWRTIRSIVKNEDDAADILQDTYLKAFSKLDQLENAESLRPWLRQIAANTARNYLVKKKPLLFSEIADEDEEKPLEIEDDRLEALPEAQLDQRETQRLVREMLDALSDKQRVIMSLYYDQELSVKQIAEQLGIPQNTVKSQLRYGRQNIEKRVRELEKQGVKLYGLSPILLYRMLLKSKQFTPPKTISNLEKLIVRSAANTIKNSAGAMQELTAIPAKTALTIRVVASVLAMVAIGSVVGVGLWLKNKIRLRDDVFPEPVIETMELPEPTEEQYEEEEPPYKGVGWEEGFLSELAASYDNYDDYMRHYGELWEVFQSRLKSGTEQKELYFGDFNGDGTPQIMQPGVSMNGSHPMSLLWSWTEDGAECDNLGDILWRDQGSWMHNGDAWNLKVSILYNPEQGYIYYNTGHGKVAVWHYTNDDTLEDCYFYQDVDYYRSLPEAGSLSQKIDAEYPASLEIYTSCYTIEKESVSDSGEVQKYGTVLSLKHLTLAETGEEYFFVCGEEVSEEEYRIAESDLLASVTWRGLDQTQVPQLQSIPGGEVTGPIDVRELVELLGGFDDRPEWSEAKALYENAKSYDEVLCTLPSFEDRFLLMLEEQYPEENFQAGEWSYAVVTTGIPETYYETLRGPTIVIRYHQRESDGGNLFFGMPTVSLLQNGSGKPIFNFYRIDAAEANDSNFFVKNSGTEASLFYRVFKQSSLGMRPFVRYESGIPFVNCLPPDYDNGLPGGELYPVIFRSAEELTARYSIDPQSEELDIGNPVTTKELYGIEDGESLLARFIPILENPELLNDPLLEGWQDAEWEAAVISEDTLILHGTREVERGTEQRYIMMDNYCIICDPASFTEDNEQISLEQLSDTPIYLTEPDEYSTFIRLCWKTGNTLYPYVDMEGSLRNFEPSYSRQEKQLVFHAISEIVQKIQYGPLTLDLAD